MKEKIKKVLKSKLFYILIIIVLFVAGLRLYTNYLSKLFDNSSPHNAIAEYVYKVNSTYEIFFMEIDEAYDADLKKDKEHNYYTIRPNIFGLPNNMGGTFEVKQVGNYYYVTSYDNMRYE
ncbi:MAG: hypothetical protein ACLRT4_07860 [Thomasclavelia sp.]